MKNILFVIATCFFIFSCKKKGCTDENAVNYNINAKVDDGSCEFLDSVRIGQFFQGGIVFYLDSMGGGLIAASEDQITDYSSEWGCYQQEIMGGNGVNIGTGKQNTDDIVNSNCHPNNLSNSIAAYICDTLNLNGYNDWYLPSKDELNAMYENIGSGNTLGLGNVGNFALTYYWSSTQINADYACKQNFGDGYQGNYCKYAGYLVRAIRAF
tara:strand:+ start:31771 stop:32403 length:633 start_codon:yes stop_codon:yes gene_type:complete